MYVMLSPAVTAAGPVLSTEMSAWVLTVVVCVAELLAAFASGVVLASLAVLLRVVLFAVAESTLTTSVSWLPSQRSGTPDS